MIFKGDTILVPDKDLLLENYDEKFDAVDYHFVFYKEKTHEVFLIHSFGKPFQPNTTIEVTEIFGVGMGQYQSRTGKYYKNIILNINWEIFANGFAWKKGDKKQKVITPKENSNQVLTMDDQEINPDDLPL